VPRPSRQCDRLSLVSSRETQAPPLSTPSGPLARIHAQTLWTFSVSSEPTRHRQSGADLRLARAELAVYLRDGARLQPACAAARPQRISGGGNECRATAVRRTVKLPLLSTAVSAAAAGACGDIKRDWGLLYV
jgi:hypothetical protein